MTVLNKGGGWEYVCLAIVLTQKGLNEQQYFRFLKVVGWQFWQKGVQRLQMAAEIGNARRLLEQVASGVGLVRQPKGRASRGKKLSLYSMSTLVTPDS